MGGGCQCSQMSVLPLAGAGLLCFARILQAKEHRSVVGEPMVLPQGVFCRCVHSVSLLWPWGCGNRDRERGVYWFASLALGDRYFEVVKTGYKFWWSLSLGPAALQYLTAVQPASASSEDLALVLPVEPSWHKRPFYFGPAAICAKS